MLCLIAEKSTVPSAFNSGSGMLKPSSRMHSANSVVISSSVKSLATTTFSLEDFVLVLLSSATFRFGVCSAWLVGRLISLEASLAMLGALLFSMLATPPLDSAELEHDVMLNIVIIHIIDRTKLLSKTMCYPHWY